MNRFLKQLSMISYDSPSFPWEEHEKSSFLQLGDQETGLGKETEVPKVPWQAYSWAIFTPLQADSWNGASLQYTTCLLPWIYAICAEMDILCIQIEHLEEYLNTNSNRAPKWGNVVNLAYLAIINGRRVVGRELTWISVKFCTWQKGLDNSKLLFFCAFNLGTSILACPESKMSDSSEFCHCSLLGTLLKKIFVRGRMSSLRHSHTHSYQQRPNAVSANKTSFVPLSK